MVIAGNYSDAHCSDLPSHQPSVDQRFDRLLSVTRQSPQSQLSPGASQMHSPLMAGGDGPQLRGVAKAIYPFSAHNAR